MSEEEEFDFVLIAREIAKQKWTGQQQRDAERMVRIAETPLQRARLVDILLMRALEPDTAEKRLIAGIIACAVLDLATGDSVDKQSAARFFMGKHFPELCSYTSLDPEYAIRQLIRAKLIKRKPSLWGNF